MPGLFGRSKRHKIDPLTAHDWITNVSVALAERASEHLESPKHNAPQLVLFTAMESIRSTGNLLRTCPEAVEAIGDILLEFRLFYDTIWQDFLLGKFDDKDKVSKLYAVVQLSQDNLWKAIFENNKKIETLLGSVLKKHSYEKVFLATELYMRGGLTPDSQAKLDQIAKEMPGINPAQLELCLLLLFEIEDLLRKRSIQLSKKKSTLTLWQLYDHTEQSLTNTLLTSFDLRKCNVIEFPPEFYMPGP